MKYVFLILIFLASCAAPKKCCSQVKKAFKFSTFYVAANGGTSLSDEDIYSVDGSTLVYDTIFTPYDYSLTMGIRKIKRFNYEGSTPFKDGFADIEYFESTQRLRLNGNKKLSFNLGAVQRLAEPYGYDPLEEWAFDNNRIHYTCLAIEEGYNVDVYESEYKDPNGNIVATSSEVWNEVVMPEMLKDYVEKKRSELDNQWQYSLVVGFDFYHYKKNFWLHTWGNLMPYHYDDGGQFSYHNFNNGEQWYDYSGGLIFGYKLNKNLGCFVEGKYNKYWNKEWYDFKAGINYIIF